ncbi:hypothetical protein [Actinoplanes sp. NPDC049599]|uniref:hypothetical protein n=1 Tax=Actinoplanes sp. NPDC049599 TaxID=3363903 RepID=UPI003787CFE4
MVNQTGHTDHGDVIQPARDSNHYGDRITQNYYGSTPGPDDQSIDEESAESSSASGSAAALGGSGLGLLAFFGLLGYFIFGGDEPFPTQSDPWPVGVERVAVIAAAGSWFEKCQKSESASPINCPQSLIETSGKVSKAHWAFYGSYLEAPVIQYSEGESRFDMLGTVVVSADYTVSKKARRVVTPMKYWAKVNWIDGQLEVQEIKEHSAVGDPEVVKVEPRQPWGPVETRLKNEFDRCLRGATSAMPAGCPDWQLPADAKKVKWSLTEDPLLTARASFDSKFGVFRVKGTYGVAVDYTSRDSMRSEVRNTNYEALVTTSEAGPVVLQIKDLV